MPCGGSPIGKPKASSVSCSTAATSDPIGLQISDFLHSSMQKLSRTVGWSPENLIIDRFGLNYDFIMENRLSWIDGLETGSGKDLSDPDHDHQFSASTSRPTSKNTVSVRLRPTRSWCDQQAARQLIRDAIGKYLDPDARQDYQDSLTDTRRHLEFLIREKARLYSA